RTPAMTERIRTTISISPEVHELFKRMADAGNMSVSRAMGEWLEDTSDAIEMIVLKMEEAKRAPMQVMRELQAMVAGLSDLVDSDMEMVRQKTARGVRGASRAAASVAPAPSSNTGLNTPKQPKRRGV